ncbi:hypothetical protein D1007_07090 [Hordeum vulgare]|nr:hypothetical protein D1007_07090 [Hordeum vulgare]
MKYPNVFDEGQGVILSQGTVAALQGLAMELDDGPSMSLFKEGTEYFEWFNMDVDKANKYKEANKGQQPKASSAKTMQTVLAWTLNQNVIGPQTYRDNHLHLHLEIHLYLQNRHWAVVVVNLMHKKINVFDSIKNSGDVTLLEIATNNVITNINKVANCESPFKFALNCFEIVTPVSPTEGTHYNCGFYAVLYLENYNGVVMIHFDETYIPNLRKCIATNLLKHPSNNLDRAEQLRKVLKL